MISKEARMPLSEIPLMARNDELGDELFKKQIQQASSHKLFLGDSRNMSEVESGSIHLIITSPPYWILKKYNAVEGQLGSIQDYSSFLDGLSKVIKECYRVLAEGGRFI